MIKNPSDAAVRRIMKENDVVQSAIQLANSGYSIIRVSLHRLGREGNGAREGGGLALPEFAS